MSDVINTFGNQVENVISNIKPVNIINYSIIPGVIVCILTLIIMIFIGIPLSGTSKVNECTMNEGKQICKKVDWSNKNNIIFYIIIPIALGLIGGGTGYKIGFLINNPTFGTAMVGTNMMKNAIFN